MARTLGSFGLLPVQSTILFCLVVAGVVTAGRAEQRPGANDVAATARGEVAGREVLPRRPLRMLVDEYHQRPQPPSFSQGISLNPDERALTNHYATDASAIVNGLFSTAHLIADDFDVRVSREPLDERLLAGTDAYAIVCPPSAAKGNPHPLTADDADRLEAFVARGGILVLVYNSIASPEADGLDYPGMSRLAGKFGMKLQPTTTQSLLIPVPPDHPTFIGVRHAIYGNGCTIGLEAQAGTTHTVLLESNNPDVPGPVAVRARHGKGTALLVGDAGVFGNAHLARYDVGHARAVQQLFHCLLPDGPLPRYGWKPGLRMKVSLSHELAVSGAPHGMRLLDLPLDPAARSVLAGVRELDLQSAPGAAQASPPGPGTRRAAPAPSPSAQALPAQRYLLARANWQAQAELQFRSDDGRSLRATWQGQQGEPVTSRLTPRGVVVDSSAGDGLRDWRWALANAVLVGPLDSAAQIGDTWTAPVHVAVPNAQLRPTPLLREAEATFRLARRERFRGRDCLVVTRTVLTPLPDLRPQDLVNPDFADYFDGQKVRLRDAGHTEVLTGWIDADTLLPLRTELQASTSFWWTNRDEEDRYVSGHDHRVFETSHQTRRVIILGRLLSADFERVDAAASP